MLSLVEHVKKFYNLGASTLSWIPPTHSNLHAQLCSWARDLNVSLSIRLCPNITCASSDGSGETVQMQRLV